MKKIVLNVVAVLVKIFATTILGLIFTNDLEIYTRYVSRTNDLSPRFLLFIFSVDILTILIVANITNAFFKDIRDRIGWTIERRIKSYIFYSVIAVAIFLLTDVLFIMQIKSEKSIHHLFTILLLAEKYIVFLLISLAYILQIHKIPTIDRARLFLNYQTFKFKNVMSSKMFKFSKVFYNTGFAVAAYITLIFYINIVTLFLYTRTVFFFLNIAICGVLLAFLLMVSVHQIKVILGIYHDYFISKQINSCS